MSVFGKLVKTVVNVAALPIAAVKDIYTLGGVATGRRESYTRERIETLIEDADAD